jgi:hypothetical protein
MSTAVKTSRVSPRREHDLRDVLEQLYQLTERAIELCSEDWQEELCIDISEAVVEARGLIKASPAKRKEIEAFRAWVMAQYPEVAS